MKKVATKKLTIIGIICLSLIIFVLICDRIVAWNASGHIYDNVDSIPHRKVGLILGTSPISTWSGKRNHYFDYRIKAGADLYKAGKIDWIVVSGGDYRNSENGYDEPIAMRDSLMKQGVDSARIVLDYDGTRTLNSIAKIRDVYCQDSIIIISQKYHNERALYQAKHLGIDAIAFNAKTPGRRTSWWRNRGREVLARVKMFIDIFTGTDPSFDKKKIELHIPPKTDNPTSFLGLFYGLEKNADGEYMDSVLDTIPEVTHKEFSSIWYIPSDSVRFEMTLGIYLDKEYPSDAVRKTVFQKLNSIIPDGFSYDIDNRQESILKSGVNTTQSVKSFLDGWENLFNKVSKLNGYNPKFANYPMIVGSRGCAICHKIYEDSLWATYIIEMSVDYHSSCGCPSSADYYTINKRSGDILNLSESIPLSKRYDVANMIRHEYEKEAKAKGFTPSNYAGNELIDKANGIAKLNEWMIIYFHPYNIGCGAEGQYNLILPIIK